MLWTWENHFTVSSVARIPGVTKIKKTFTLNKLALLISNRTMARYSVDLKTPCSNQSSIKAATPITITKTQASKASNWILSNPSHSNSHNWRKADFRRSRNPHTEDTTLGTRQAFNLPNKPKKTSSSISTLRPQSSFLLMIWCHNVILLASNSIKKKLRFMARLLGRASMVVELRSLKTIRGLSCFWRTIMSRNRSSSSMIPKITRVWWTTRPSSWPRRREGKWRISTLMKTQHQIWR